jgi:hypothetical protein
LGKYKIADTFTGYYGKGYRLDGMDESNCNARCRDVVFHYFEPQTTLEFAEHNYFSLGCPMLAKSSFAFCDSLIQQECEPVVMWIYK